jgi:hypothetical protein
VLHLVLAGAAMFGGLLALLVALRARGRALVGGLRSVLDRIGLRALGARLEAPLESFAGGLSAIGSTAAMWRLFVATAAIWAGEAALVGGPSARTSWPAWPRSVWSGWVRAPASP